MNLVFPDTQDFPAKLLERLVNLLVTPLVSDDLRRPKCGIRLRKAAMQRAAMPEASVYEDGKPESAKHYVWCSR